MQILPYIWELRTAVEEFNCIKSFWFIMSSGGIFIIIGYFIISAPKWLCVNNLNHLFFFVVWFFFDRLKKKIIILAIMWKLFISSTVSIIEPQKIYNSLHLLYIYIYFLYAALIYYFVVEILRWNPDRLYSICFIYIKARIETNKSRKFSSHSYICVSAKFSHDQNPLI